MRYTVDLIIVIKAYAGRGTSNQSYDKGKFNPIQDYLLIVKLTRTKLFFFCCCFFFFFFFFFLHISVVLIFAYFVFSHVNIRGLIAKGINLSNVNKHGTADNDRAIRGSK